MKHVRRQSRNFQRGYKILNPTAATPKKPLIIGFPKSMIDKEWKARNRVSFPQRPNKEDFFKSDTWLRFKLMQSSLKQSKKELIIEKRKVYNKILSEDGLNCKQRRKEKLRKEGKVFGQEWYLKNIKK